VEYEAALNKAWSQLVPEIPADKKEIRFLADDYDIDLINRRVLSAACNVPAKGYISIILLHYLLKSLKGIPAATGEWISFRDLDGGQAYYPTFKSRVLEPILRKYGSDPEAICGLIKRFDAVKAQHADAGVILKALEGVPILITMTGADEDFGAQANMLFDKSIKDIFCTEDVTVLSEIIAHSI